MITPERHFCGELHSNSETIKNQECSKIGLKHAGCSSSEVAGIVQKADGILLPGTLEYVETAVTLAYVPEI